MDTEHRTTTAEKVLRPAYRGIVVPQEKFAELLEASVRIQDMTNQVNILITNAAAIVGETLKELTQANSLPHSASA